ncbi:hypothetical protein WA026_007433 [Henosepilachna vigintioctopunctata]|uniref:Sulfotransferase domain-containing protein n=2 Tax=Henosepilachna vigintioctopunctata TaxID=420089 RepID=A0AAW1ULV0_9CUCU
MSSLQAERSECEKKEDFPFEISDVVSSVNEKLLQDFHGERTGFIQVGHKKWFFPSTFRGHLPKLYNFEIRPTDVWIVTFPRSGTTLTQEMVWLLMNNLDFDKASSASLAERFPFIEGNCIFHPELHAELLKENKDSEEKTKVVEKLIESVCDKVHEMKGRRFIKTHLPLSLLPKNLLTAGCKVIYVARNPKDVVISYYLHNRLFRTRNFTKDFPKYWQYFKTNYVSWSPYWEHVIEAWEKRNEENLLFLFYENMIKKMKKTISEVQHFLGTAYSDDQISSLENHLNIDNFRKNKSVNHDDWKILGIFNKNEQDFIRAGENGEAKRWFDEDMEREAKEWIQEHLKNSDLKFPSI